MAIMAMDTQIKKSLVCILGLLSSFSYAGDFKVTPSVELKETYSDNIELTSTESKSSLVSQASIGFSADYNAQDANFQLESRSTYALYSHDHELDTDYHTLSASALSAIGDTGLTANGKASIRYVPRNSSRNGIASIILGDVVQVETYQAGLEYQAGNSAYNFTSALNYQTNRSEDNIGESDGVSFTFVSTNGAGAKNLFWNTTGNYDKRESDTRDSTQHIFELKLGLITQYKLNPFIRYYDEDNSGNVNQRTNSLNTNSYGIGVRWLPVARLYIDVSYNEPIDDSLNSNGEEQDAFIDALIDWQPTSRTRIQASHSQRFFGDSYGLNINHRNKRLSNTISYNEQVQSFTRDNYRSVSSIILCQDPNAASLDDCFLSNGDIVNPEDTSLITINDLELVEDNDYWLNKTARWNSTLSLPRTNFNFAVTHSVRENLNTQRENKTDSLTFSANRKLGPHTSLDFSSSYSERTYDRNSDAGQTDIYRRYQLNLIRKLSSSLNTSLAILHTNRSSNNARFNYDENRITATITKDF